MIEILWRVVAKYCVKAGSVFSFFFYFILFLFIYFFLF